MHSRSNAMAQKRLLEFNPNAQVDDGSCVEAVVNGCMDELACNYNSEANTDDSSCYSADQYYDCNEVCLNDCKIFMRKGLQMNNNFFFSGMFDLVKSYFHLEFINDL